MPSAREPTGVLCRRGLRMHLASLDEPRGDAGPRLPRVVCPAASAARDSRLHHRRDRAAPSEARPPAARASCGVLHHRAPTPPSRLLVPLAKHPAALRVRRETRFGSSFKPSVRPPWSRRASKAASARGSAQRVSPALPLTPDAPSLLGSFRDQRQTSAGGEVESHHESHVTGRDAMAR